MPFEHVPPLVNVIALLSFVPMYVLIIVGLLSLGASLVMRDETTPQKLAKYAGFASLSLSVVISLAIGAMIACFQWLYYFSEALSLL